MAAGEYVSVSTQRDTEQAILARERQKLRESPEEELAELASIYETKGVTAETAKKVAKEMSDHDVFAAHAYAEHGIDPHDLTNPWHAAIASAISFVFGAIVPLLAILLPPDSLRIIVTYIAVVIALAATGTMSARFGRASARRASVRVVAGGLIAMTVTYFIGQLFHVSGV
jgi:VIT1/CCC1 family predicted Fe2+/Mn2+ transporter